MDGLSRSSGSPSLTITWITEPTVSDVTSDLDASRLLVSIVLMLKNRSMRRPFRVVSDPISSKNLKEGTLKDKLLEWYGRNTKLVVVSFIFFLLLTLWLRRWQPFSGMFHETVYSVVFDAGSTGSRVHAYQFDINRNGRFILKGDDFHQLKPGISSYANNPEQAGASLDPLLTAIDGVVPKAKMSETPCQLRATAGLRMIPMGQSLAILESATATLGRTGYNVDQDAVSILDGNYEGAYAWLTVSYLLEKLNGLSNVTAIDLGGGSVQESFEIPSDSEDAESITKVHSDGGERFVYVHSYLNYGLMAARGVILKFVDEGKDHACLAKGFDGYYDYGNTRIKAKNLESGSTSTCRDIVRRVLNLNKPCKGPSEQCTFNGVWGGPVDRHQQQDRSIYLFSYFWDRAVDVGVVPSTGVISQSITSGVYSEHAHEICGNTMERLESEFPKIDRTQLPYLCMDLMYISVLLTEGFQIDPFQEVQLTKQINYKGENIETSWTLGAAIDSMAKSRSRFNVDVQ